MMTGSAELISGRNQIRLVSSAMNIVAPKTGDSINIHLALHIVVTLHSILVCGSFWPMGKRFFAEMRRVKFPHVGKSMPWSKTNRPIKVFAIDRIVGGNALRMTLDADIIGTNMVESGWVDDCFRDRIKNMRPTRTMAGFATNIPFGHSFGLDVIVHRVTAVA